MSSSEDLESIWRERISDARGYLATTLTGTEIEFVISVATATRVESIIDAMESQQIRMEALPEIFDLSAKVYRDLVRRIRAKQSTIQISVGEVTAERVKRSGIWHFSSKIAGVSHANPDGVSRQSIIARIHIGEWLRLHREPNNPHDANAVVVKRQSGEQIGYLLADIAAEVVSNLNEGYRYWAQISDLTGGTADRPTRGVNITLFVASADVSDGEVRAYLNQSK